MLEIKGVTNRKMKNDSENVDCYYHTVIEYYKKPSFERKVLSQWYDVFDKNCLLPLYPILLLYKQIHNKLLKYALNKVARLTNS